MKALTLWQPWASLCVLPRPCGQCGGSGFDCAVDGHGLEGHGMSLRCICSTCDGNLLDPFKAIETRSWPAPKTLIGQRIAIHAAKREPEQEVGDLTCFRRDDGTWGLESWRPRVEFPYDVPLGAVVGTAVLTDCVPMVDDGGYRYGQHELPHGAIVLGDGHAPNHPMLGRMRHGQPPVDVSDQLPFGDFAPGRWAWLLTEAVAPDEPIPCRGGQRIWNVPTEVASRLAA